VTDTDPSLKQVSVTRRRSAPGWPSPGASFAADLLCARYA